MAGTMSGSTMTEPRHIKSRERVRDLGEVYTQPREVNAMLDLIPGAFANIDTRFLEPAAGDGNFLVAILERKISVIDETKHGGSEHWYEFALLRCLASTVMSQVMGDSSASGHRSQFLCQDIGDTPDFFLGPRGWPLPT